MMEPMIGFLNGHAVTWLTWMLRMSWQVAALVAVIWLVTRAFRKSSAGFRHLLWVLVFVKLLVPPTLAAPWSAGNLIPALSVSTPTAATTSEVFRGQPPDTTPALLRQRFTARPQTPLTPPAFLLSVWAAVALGLFSFIAVQYIRYSRRNLKHRSPAPEAFQRMFSARAEALGVRKLPLLMVSAVIQTPAVFGFSRPVILLPEQWENTMSREEMSSVLAHELAHIKRLDMVVTWLATLLGCLYWFHPGVWLAHVQLRREREMACDDMALHSTKSEGKTYASTILHVAESFTGNVPVAAGFLGLLELSDNLLHRIRSVADTTRARRIGWRSAIAILIITAACVPMGRWARRPAAEETATDRQIRAHERFQLRASCATNLKRMGLVFKIWATEHDGRWPRVSTRRGNFMAKASDIYPNYLTDVLFLRCPGNAEHKPAERGDPVPDLLRQITDKSYFYLGWVLTNEEEGLSLLDAYESKALAGAYEDIPVPMGKGTGGQNVIHRIYEGVERFLITDTNDPTAPARMQSGIPVMWERPGHHEPDGGNVLYMDGHVEFVEYPGKFPMTPKFMDRLIEISAKKDAK